MGRVLVEDRMDLSIEYVVAPSVGVSVQHSTHVQSKLHSHRDKKGSNAPCRAGQGGGLHAGVT